MQVLERPCETCPRCLREAKLYIVSDPYVCETFEHTSWQALFSFVYVRIKKPNQAKKTNPMPWGPTNASHFVPSKLGDLFMFATIWRNMTGRSTNLVTLARDIVGVWMTGPQESRNIINDRGTDIDDWDSEYRNQNLRRSCNLFFSDSCIYISSQFGGLQSGIMQI